MEAKLLSILISSSLAMAKRKCSKEKVSQYNNLKHGIGEYVLNNYRKAYKNDVQVQKILYIINLL